MGKIATSIVIGLLEFLVSRWCLTFLSGVAIGCAWNAAALVQSRQELAAQEGYSRFCYTFREKLIEIIRQQHKANGETV